MLIMGMRSALERTTHRIVVPRRMPPPFSGARIYVSTEGGLRYLTRTMADTDPSLLRLTAEIVRPGSTVWDIGANVGLFSFASAVAAGSAGRVLAVEPDPVMAALLRRSAAANSGHAPVEVLPAAVSDGLSVARFHVARRNRATNHLDGFGARKSGDVRTTQLVLTVTLDWLAARFPAPDVIKIDVEEAELAVLAGGGRVLQQCPTIICEVAGRNTTAAWDVLTAHGYVIYDGDLPPGERTELATAPFNTLAVSPVGVDRAAAECGSGFHEDGRVPHS
jgi:FkbM family methyltransferase